MTISMSELRQSLPLKIETSAVWAPLVVRHLDEFLVDHASCERKAHAAAMMLVHKFPEHHFLQDRMIELAKEELEHFHQVVKILRGRGLTLGSDDIDTYVKALLTHVRHPRDHHLLDRLLVVSIVEARSCERFCLIAEALPAGELKSFYENFAREESAHMPLFLRTAKEYYSADVVDQRINELLAIEAELLPQIAITPKVH